MKSHVYTNAVLTVIAALLAVIAWQQYTQRPVTMEEMRRLVEAGELERYQKRRMQMPYVEVRSIEAPVDVDVQGEVTVDRITNTVQVEVDR